MQKFYKKTGYKGCEYHPHQFAEAVPDFSVKNLMPYHYKNAP